MPKSDNESCRLGLRLDLVSKQKIELIDIRRYSTTHAEYVNVCKSIHRSKSAINRVSEIDKSKFSLAANGTVPSDRSISCLALVRTGSTKYLVSVTEHKYRYNSLMPLGSRHERCDFTVLISSSRIVLYAR